MIVVSFSSNLLFGYKPRDVLRNIVSKYYLLLVPHIYLLAFHFKISHFLCSCSKAYKQLMWSNEYCLLYCSKMKHQKAMMGHHII